MLNVPVRQHREEFSFTFFTNHAFVLILLGRNNTMRMRDIAEQIQITERAVQRIVDELVGSGYVSIVKSGRRNVYALNPEKNLRHPILKDHSIKELLRLGAPENIEESGDHGHA